MQINVVGTLMFLIALLIALVGELQRHRTAGKGRG